MKSLIFKKAFVTFGEIWDVLFNDSKKQYPPGTGVKMMYVHNCSISNSYLYKSNPSLLVRYELTDRDIHFSHARVKDLGYTWTDKDNKKGYRTFEIEYWLK